MQSRGADTTTRKRGNRLGFWFFRTAVSFFGPSGAYPLLYPVCLYYLLFDRAAVASSMAYVKKRFPKMGPLGRALMVYRIFINQGKGLIDRYYVVSGLGRFDIEIQGYDKISDLLEGSEKGFVLLTAHLGNWQLALTVLERFKRRVNLLMRPEENEAVKEALNIDSGGRIGVISTEEFLGGVVNCVNTLKRGEIVSIMGDRSYGADTVTVDFLGSPARFPYSAFAVATSFGCPVVVLLVAKGPGGKYLVDVSNVIKPARSTRRERENEIKRCVGEFAHIIEDYVLKYPAGWFVFYDIWQDVKDGPETVSS